MTTTAIATLDNVADLLAASGFEAPAEQTSSTLVRIKILQEPIMGVEEIKGKVRNVEVVPAGWFKIEVPNDDGAYYTESITAQIYQQRVSHYRYDKSAEGKDQYVKTVLHTDLKSDLKDTNGTFNCGKSGGFIDKVQWDAMDKARQDFVKSIKRVRTVLGTAVLTDLVDNNGNPAPDLGKRPFLMEIRNNDAFKAVGAELAKYAKAKVLPLQHPTKLWCSKEGPLPTGKYYYVTQATADLTTSYDVGPDEVATFNSFNEWIAYYNNWVLSQWNAKQVEDDLSDEDAATVDNFVDVTLDDEIPF